MSSFVVLIEALFTVGGKRTLTRLVSEDARDTVCALAGTNAYVYAWCEGQGIKRVFGQLRRNLERRKLKLQGLTEAAEKLDTAAAAGNLQLLARRAVSG